MHVTPHKALWIVAATACALAQPAHATWKARERGEVVQPARIVPRAAAASRPRSETAPAYSTPAIADRSTAVVATATGAAPGQGGYVHYFVIHKPDGIAEMQVGIELADQRIAWAFPGIGVSLSPFIESGRVAAADGDYEVRHLFGLRPFPDDGAMQRLAADLPVRIMPWIEDGVQHCDLDPPQRELCVSCLGFVLRMLFPREFPGYPALPADFRDTRAGERYTTEDLLLYLTGLHAVATREGRLVRIDELDVPQPLREELLRVVSSADSAQARPGIRERERASPARAKNPVRRAPRRADFLTSIGEQR